MIHTHEHADIVVLLPQIENLRWVYMGKTLLSRSKNVVKSYPRLVSQPLCTGNYLAYFDRSSGNYGFFAPFPLTWMHHQKACLKHALSCCHDVRDRRGSELSKYERFRMNNQSRVDSSVTSRSWTNVSRLGANTMTNKGPNVV